MNSSSIAFAVSGLIGAGFGTGVGIGLSLAGTDPYTAGVMGGLSGYAVDNTIGMVSGGGGGGGGS